LVVWAVATRGLSDGIRRTTMAATILIAVGAWVCVRTDGVTNDLKPDLHWRWTQTSEERLLAQAANEPVALPAAPAAALATPAPTEAAPTTAKVAPTTAKETPAASKETPAAAVAGPEWP